MLDSLGLNRWFPEHGKTIHQGNTYSGFVAEELHDIGFESALTYREYQGGSELVLEIHMEACMVMVPHQSQKMV